MERIHEIQLAARDIERALGIHDDADAAGFDEDVAARRAVLQIHLVLQPRAPAADNRDTQDAIRAALLGQQPADFLCGARGDFDQSFIANAETRSGGIFLGGGGNHNF